MSERITAAKFVDYVTIPGGPASGTKQIGGKSVEFESDTLGLRVYMLREGKREWAGVLVPWSAVVYCDLAQEVSVKKSAKS